MCGARFTRLLVLALLILAVPAASFAGVFVSITVAPPPLPVYVQPVCPEYGYMWTPGYWAWEDEGYYWVPGTWVPTPSIGVLWTPGYWGWDDGSYRWNDGYWGTHVGFYGGVNYGYGYGGEGFGGGEWRGDGFYYNRAVVNVDNTRITNVYVNKTVIVNNTTVNNVSYNGGRGGTRSAPTQIEQRVAQERHIPPTRQQAQHENAARQNRQLLAKYNGGKPAIAATAKPADFSRRSVVPARAAGGRVEPATLQASAKTMPPATRTTSTPRAPTRAARPGMPNSPTLDNRNVPKPPIASGRTSAPNVGSLNNHGANQAPQRPPAANVSNRNYGNSGRPNASSSVSLNQPQMRSNSPRTDSRPSSSALLRMQSQAPRPSAPVPQPRMQSQAPRPSAPVPQPRMQSQAPRPSAPAHTTPPAPHQEKGTPNERERR